jgi:MFS family permease
LSNRWLMFIILYLGGVAASANQFKVPPVMALIVQDLGFSTSTAGLLMSFFAFAGFLLALPAGLMIKTRQLKVVSIIGLSALTIGGILGALTTSPSFMLIGRALEGLGIVAMGMAGPTLISLWFPPGERGLPMGIWSSWMPTGSILMFNLAHPLVSLGGWRAVWWFVSVFSLVTLLLFTLFIHFTEEHHSLNERDGSELTIQHNWREILGKMLTNKELWLLTLMFISYNFVLSSYYSWVPVYLKEVLHIAPAKAAFTVSLIHLGIIPTTVGVGWIINQSKNYRIVYLVGFSGFTLILLKSFTLYPSITIIYMLVLGILSGLIPAAIFAATPDVVENKQYMPFAASAILWGQNIGVLLGPSSVGKLLEMGVIWDKVSYLLVLVAFVGIISALLTRVKKASKRMDLDIKVNPS